MFRKIACHLKSLASNAKTLEEYSILNAKVICKNIPAIAKFLIVALIYSTIAIHPENQATDQLINIYIKEKTNFLDEAIIEVSLSLSMAL